MSDLPKQLYKHTQCNNNEDVMELRSKQKPQQERSFSLPLCGFVGSFVLSFFLFCVCLLVIVCRMPVQLFLCN